MVRSRFIAFFGVLGAGVAMWAVGCGDSWAPEAVGPDGLLGEAGTGELRMFLTDDPFPYEFVAEAWVTVTRVEVLPAQGSDEDELTAGDLDDPDEDDDSIDSDDQIDEQDPNDADDQDGDDDSDDEGIADAEDGLEDEDRVDDSDLAADPNEADNEDDSDDVDEEGDDADDDVDDDVDDDADDDVDDDDADDDAEGRDGRPFIVVLDDPAGREFNLLELRNGRVAELFEAELPAGRYKQVRIVVSGGRVVLSDEREFPLRVPSGAASGIKLHFRFEIFADQETELLLDIDLGRAFVPTPGGKLARAGEIIEFSFRPSFAMRLADLDDSGSLWGEVVDEDGNALENVAVTAFDGEEEIAIAVTEADGGYEFIGLPPGKYRLEFEGDGFEWAALRGQRVRAGEETVDVDVVMDAE